MSAEAHKELVRAVTVALLGAIEEEEVDCAYPSKLAADIVGAVLAGHLTGRLTGHSYLINNGTVEMVGAVTSNSCADKWDGHRALHVYVMENPGGPRCIWCTASYDKKAKGAHHGLCENCYLYGPSDN